MNELIYWIEDLLKDPYKWEIESIVDDSDYCYEIVLLHTSGLKLEIIRKYYRLDAGDEKFIFSYTNDGEEVSTFTFDLRCLSGLRGYFLKRKIKKFEKKFIEINNRKCAENFKTGMLIKVFGKKEEEDEKY